MQAELNDINSSPDDDVDNEELEYIQEETTLIGENIQSILKLVVSIFEQNADYSMKYI